VAQPSILKAPALPVDCQESQKTLSAWISNLPEREKDDILLRLIKDHDPYLGAELIQQYQKSSSIKNNGAIGMKPRTVADLISKVETFAAERKRRIAEQEEREGYE
jgi:hypothetical protein